ncbi:MAG: ribose 5-phosphate isomerase B [Bacteroidetes bacterium]|nr:ribose 5-phosphate isomerase B [Bacteroidota bacterium]
MSKKISIGSDHAGVEYKRGVTDTLKSLGYSVTDHGTHTADSVDYPDFAHPVASDVETGKADFGILICGSGNGVCMTANKHQGIRAALCWTEELSALARQHNNANVLCLPARFVQLSDAVAMVKTFLSTPFEGGRHQKRVDKIGC